jgi:hypothetical protein
MIYYVNYELKEIEVNTPSTNYYARSGDSDISDITTLQELYFKDENKFNSIDEATSYLKNNIIASKSKYTILPIIIL